MPQILGEDDFGTTVMDDGGRIVVLPRGTLAPIAGPGAGAPMGIGGNAPPAPPAPLAPPPPLMSPDEAGPAGPSPELIEPVAPTAPPAAKPDMMPSWLAPIVQEATSMGADRRAAARQAADAAGRPPAPPLTGVDEVRAGYDQAESARLAAGAAEAAEQEESAKLLRERNENLDTIAADRAAQIEADQKRFAELSATQDAAVEAEASFKVDENRRWRSKSTGQKVRATIGMILAGLGQALKGKGDAPNPVIAMLQAEQERDVELQMADHDALIKRIGIRGAQIDRFDKMATDRVAKFNLRMATEMERTARELEVNAAQYASPKAKAAASEAAAELRVKKGEYLENAKNAQWNRDFQERSLVEQVKARKAQIGLGYANLKEGARQFDANLVQRQNEMFLDAAKLEQAGNIEAAKALREEAKEVRQLAVGGKAEVVGIDDKGNPIIRQEPLKDARGEIWKAPDDVSARELRDQKSATDVVAQFIDDAQRIIKANGGMTDLNKNADWQRLQANKTLIGLSIGKAFKMGAYDAGVERAMNSILAGEQITGWQSFVFDQGAGLDQARRFVVAKYNSALDAAGYDGDDYDPPNTAAFGAPAETEAGKAYKAAIAEPTASERYAAEEPGPVVSALGTANTLFGGTDQTNAQRRAKAEGEAAQDPLLGEVTQNTGDQIRKLIAKAKGGDLDARKALTALASDTREGLAGATLRALGDDGDPKLLAAVVGEMPESSRTARQSAIAGASSRATDQAVSVDLERRALAGDKQAIASLLAIVNDPAQEGYGKVGRKAWARGVLTKAIGGGQ